VECGDVVISVLLGMMLIFGLAGSFGNRCAMIEICGETRER
jgi:hypothetical protein